MFEDAAHDAVASGMNLYSGLIAHIIHIRNCICMDFTVFKLDTIGNPLHVFFADGAVGPYMVDFFLHEFGMREL